jgi:hypothetical protein
MPNPGFTRPDLCSIHTANEQDEFAEAVSGGFSADGCPPGVDDPPAHRTTGIDRAIRLSTAAAVLAVAGIAAYVSYGHTPTRSSGPTARPGSPPDSSRPRSTAWSTPARWWCCTRPGTGCRYPASPAGCLRWASPPPSPRTWHRAGPTARSGRSSRPGRRSASWVRMSFWSGSSAPAGLQTAGRHQRISELAWPAVLRGVLSRPQPLTASAPERTSAAGQTRRGAWPLGSRPAGSVTIRRLRPALSVMRRWPRTGSACRPAARCRNAGSPRCSDAPPAAGREPEWPMRGRHRRS